MAKKVTSTENNRSKLYLDSTTVLSGVKEINKEEDIENPTLGLELENEIKPSNTSGKVAEYGFDNYDHWKFHSENSLRYIGFEYVSKPTRYYDCESKIRQLFQDLKKDGCDPKYHTNSIRTSFHVHFNQTPRTLYETILFTAVYYIFEPFLQDFCGKHRQNNLFCLRLEDTRSVANGLAEVLEGSRAFSSALLANSEFRYGSVNFNSLFKFGTIEYRMMRASSKPDDLILWFVALAKIRKFALECGSFEKVRQLVTDLPMKDFIDLVLGKYVVGELDDYLCSYTSKEVAVRNGYVNALPILVAGCGYKKEDMLEIRERSVKEHEEFKNKVMSKYSGTTVTATALTMHDLATTNSTFGTTDTGQAIKLKTYTGVPF